MADLFFDLLKAGLGFISGEEFRERVLQREACRSVRERNKALQVTIDIECFTLRRKEQVAWEKWLRPTKRSPDPVIVNAKCDRTT